MKNNRLNPNTTLRRSPEPMQASLGDEVVMMSLEQGNYYGLDPVGAHIWELLSEPLTVNELVEKLLTTYAVDRAVCERETLAFLNRLLEEKLVVIENQT